MSATVMMITAECLKANNPLEKTLKLLLTAHWLKLAILYSKNIALSNFSQDSLNINQGFHQSQLTFS